MEDVLDVYTRPYDRDHPLVCMDETSKQQIMEVRLRSAVSRAAAVAKTATTSATG